MAKKYYVGDLRPSQLLLSFGVGALIELPRLSTLVMGLDEWNTQGSEEIREPRLLAAIQSINICANVKRLLSPPFEEGTGTPAYLLPGVPVATFPRWMVCPACRLLASIDSELFVLDPNTKHP